MLARLLYANPQLQPCLRATGSRLLGAVAGYHLDATTLLRGVTSWIPSSRQARAQRGSVTARWLQPWRVPRRTAIGTTIQRDSRFAKLTAADISFFQSVLGDAGMVQDPEALKVLNTDWLHNWSGDSKLALRPKTTQELSKVLAYCHQRRLAVVPQGGNTGLVGGSVPLFDEVIVSMSRMNSIISLDPLAGIVTCEAGVVLERLNEYLEERDFVMPLDLGAKGSCHVGGNAATNAGGIRFLRYGSLHGSILGLEAVLADGTVLDSLSSLRKDNTGYDVKQLFIGSEGTLGIITKLAILVPRKPKAVHVAFFGLSSYEKCLATLVRARSELSEVLSAVEFLDRSSLELVTRHLPGARDPLAASYPFYVLIETSGSDAEHDNEKLNRFLESVMTPSSGAGDAPGGDALVQDGTLAQDRTQMKALWKLREGIAEALMKNGVVYKYDISLPTDKMYDFVEDMQRRLGQRALVVGYGHLGDGNLHLNVSVPQHSTEVHGLIEPYLFERVHAHKGSVSAEHGMGQCKVKYLHFSKSPEAIGVMQRIKNLFDPHGILNPYKVLPARSAPT